MSKISKAFKKLKKALSAGSDYSPAPGNLQYGAKLEVENLDLQKIGLYSQDQKDKLLEQGVPEDDFILANETGMGRWGNGYWARKSDEGVKRYTFYDTGLKLHKTLQKKD